jgi:hypothetical protein
MPPQVRKERPRVVQSDGGIERDRLRSERKRRLHRYRIQLLCSLLVPMFSAFPSAAEKKTFRQEDAPP